MRPVSPVLLALLLACAGGTRAPGPCPPGERGQAGDPIALSSLSCFSRIAEPVLRDPIPGIGYEVASDGHVFRDSTGQWRMIYTGDVADKPSIKLATGTALDRFAPTAPLLWEPGPGGVAPLKETSFYRLTADGHHEITFIGYDDEATYQSEIYVARAETLEGPYTIGAAPIVPRGQQAGRDVYLMTSPSVIEHEGTLHLAYLAWNAVPDQVTEVWVMGRTSTDDGQTWSEAREIDAPIGMEGQITKGPDGRYYAASLQSHRRSEAIFLAVADHPFGPYQALTAPVLTKAGPPLEVDESNAPMLYFHEEERTAYLYYVGADYRTGWWMMAATAPY